MIPFTQIVHKKYGKYVSDVRNQRLECGLFKKVTRNLSGVLKIF